MTYIIDKLVGDFQQGGYTCTNQLVAFNGYWPLTDIYNRLQKQASEKADHIYIPVKIL